APLRCARAAGLAPTRPRGGREARYGDVHVERLQLINELRERGLRLSAIAELVQGATDEATITDWLGLREQLQRPWSEDKPVLLSEEEVDARLGGMPDGMREGLVAYGVIERRADTTPV